jgi:hypothetical protein
MIDHRLTCLIDNADGEKRMRLSCARRKMEEWSHKEQPKGCFLP